MYLRNDKILRNEQSHSKEIKNPKRRAQHPQASLSQETAAWSEQIPERLHCTEAALNTNQAECNSVRPQNTKSQKKTPGSKLNPSVTQGAGDRRMPGHTSQPTQTNQQGQVRVTLKNQGKWFLRNNAEGWGLACACAHIWACAHTSCTCANTHTSSNNNKTIYQN